MALTLICTLQRLQLAGTIIFCLFDQVKILHDLCHPRSDLAFGVFKNLDLEKKSRMWDRPQTMQDLISSELKLLVMEIESDQS